MIESSLKLITLQEQMDVYLEACPGITIMEGCIELDN